jgi:phosphoserine phosphatase RsbU/P
LLAMVMFSRIFIKPMTDLGQVQTPAVVTIDADSLVQDWNDQAVRMFGYTEAEALGQPLTELIMPMRYRQAHRDGIARLLQQDAQELLGVEKVYVVMAFRADRPDREFPIEVTVKTDLNAQGCVVFQGRIRKLLAF